MTIRVERDVRYGEAAIGHGTDKPTVRPLLMDVYLPEGCASPAGRPALVLSHGGAFHHGGKDRDEFEQGGSHNTPVHAYCERFAARGYACFSIGYRLTQELAWPPALPIKRNRETVQRARIDWVRQQLGLPVASHMELIYGAEGAYTDVAHAFRFIHANAARWGIAADRMAIGGFSAGGIASAYAVFALGVPAAAIFCLSAGMDLEDAEYYVRGMPPVLLFTGEHDLPAVPERAQALASCAVRAGLGVRHYVVLGKPHFYERASTVVLQQTTLPGGDTCATVEEVFERFLTQSLVPCAVDVDRLDAFAQAWTRHDIDALMGFMANDCEGTWGSGRATYVSDCKTRPDPDTVFRANAHPGLAGNKRGGCSTVALRQRSQEQVGGRSAQRHKGGVVGPTPARGTAAALSAPRPAPTNPLATDPRPPPDPRLPPASRPRTPQTSRRWPQVAPAPTPTAPIDD
jgi:acetyl esterase/lipase